MVNNGLGKSKNECEYEILSVDTDLYKWYEVQIKQGYAKNRIK